MKLLFSIIGSIIFFQTIAQEPRLVIPAGKPNRSLSLALSADTRKAAAFDRSNLVSIWDSEKGFFLTDIFHPSAHTAVVSIPNNNEILIASEDSILRIINIRNQQTINSWNIGFVPYLLESGADGKNMLLQNASELVLLHRDKTSPVFRFSADIISGSALSHNGKFLAFIKEDTAFVYHTSDGSLVNAIAGNFSIGNPVFSRDDKYLYTSYYAEGNIYNIASGDWVTELKSHKGDINFAVFSPDGSAIATCSEDSTVKLWNVKNGKLFATFGGHKGEVNHADFNFNGTRLITSALDKTAKNQREVMAWNTVTKRKEFSIPLGRLPLNSARYSTDGHRIIIDFLHTEPPRIVDANSGEMITRFQPLVAPVSDVAFNKTGDRILSLSGDKVTREWDMSKAKVKVTDTRNYYQQVYTGYYSPDFKRVLVPRGLNGIDVWDTTTRQKLFSLDTGSYISGGQFSPDGKFILTTSVFNDVNQLFGDARPKIWNAETGEFVYALNGHKDGVTEGIFNGKGNLIATASTDSTVKIWDAKDGKLLYSFVHQDGVSKVSFSDDDQYVASASEKGNVKIWHVTTGKTSFSVDAGESIRTVRISPDLSKILTLSASNAMKLWDHNSGKELYQFFAIGLNDHFIKSKELYYLATPEAAKKLYYVNDNLEVITFDQLDIKYNRPDLVLSAMHSRDTGLISAYHKAWQKRTARLGVDTTAFRDGLSLPVTQIIKRETIAYNRSIPDLKIRISARDMNYNLTRFNIWVNESPLYGAKGITIDVKKGKSFDTTVSIPLSSGVNAIETSVLNSNGGESYRVPLYVKYQPKTQPKEKLYFTGIGIDIYKEQGHKLDYSVKDIRDLALALKKKYKGQIIIDTLFNEKVTIANVKALKARLRKTSIHDKVILAYSGHGLLSKDYDYFLSTHLVNFMQPQEGGLPYELLENLLDSIPARKKLMLIDACHSGEVDKEVMNDYVKVLGDSSKTGLKGVIVENMNPSRIGMKNSFELMQELFANVSRSTGATVISAAAGTQLAQERGDLKNGVFSFSILELMKQRPTATISELKNYVSNRVAELTNGLQIPTTRTETKMLDWKVW